MADYPDDLLDVADRLLSRNPGRRGPLPSARVRRSISSSYYALFHFLTAEAVARLVGTYGELRWRRGMLARSFTHTGIGAALDKVRGAYVDKPVMEFLRRSDLTEPTARLPSPGFAQAMAKAFEDTRAKREDADYDLNLALTEADARLVHSTVAAAIAGWRGANSDADKDFKYAFALLMILKGQLKKQS